MLKGEETMDAEWAGMDDQSYWPDSLSITEDNELYVTSSQIGRMPRFSNGVDRRTLPCRFFRIWLGTF